MDHHHGDSVFRGFICMNCNTMIGFAKDDVSILKNGIKYLIDYKNRNTK